MSNASEQLKLWGPVVILLGILIVQWSLAFKKRSDLRKILGKADKLKEALEREWLNTSSKKLLVRKPLKAEVEDWLSHTWSVSWASRLGTVYTAVALAMSFVLVAQIMMHDVAGAMRNPTTASVKRSEDASKTPPSVNAAGGDVAASPTTKELLASGVSRMGAKFLISALGVLLAILDSVYFGWWTTRVIGGRGKSDMERAIDELQGDTVPVGLGGGGKGASDNSDSEKGGPSDKEKGDKKPNGFTDVPAGSGGPSPEVAAAMQEMSKVLVRIEKALGQITGDGPEPRIDPEIVLQRIERHRAI
jgi:hypothetical protein